MPSLLDYADANPFRRPDWRWRRVELLLAEDRPISRRRDDPQVRRLYRFQQQLRASQSRSAVYVLSDLFPDVYWAYDLYTAREMIQPNEGKRTQAFALEARILAGQSNEEIFERMGVRVATVEAYHNSFFDVRARLTHTDYLMSQVIGPAVYFGLRSRDYDLLWKLYALWGGPHVIDSLISTFTTPSHPATAADVPRFQTTAVRGNMARLAMTASRVLDANSFNASEILDLYLKMLDIEKKAGEGGNAQSAIMDIISGVMVSMPFSVGTRPSEDFKRPPTNVVGHLAYDNSAVELKGSELLQLGAGEEIVVEEYEFPPPPHRTVS